MHFGKACITACWVAS